MNMDQTLNELVNPTVDTAVTTLKARAYAGYDAAAQILKRLHPESAGEDSAVEADPKFVFVNALILEMRHVALDRAIIESGVSTIFDLPCGYTQRVFEMTDLGKTYIGGDLPLVIESVEPIIGDMISPDKKNLVKFVNVDVTNYNTLEEAVADVDGPICISTEGLSVYLNKDEKILLRKNIRNLLAEKGGCWLTADPETASYYWAALSALVEDEEKARELITAILHKFASQSDTDIIGSSYALNTSDSGQLFRSDYDSMLKLYRSDGFKVERIPYYREDFKLHLFSKMTDEQTARLMERLKNVHIWSITADPDFAPAQKNAAAPENEKVYSEENCKVSVETVNGKMHAKLCGRIDTLSSPLFLKSWQEESASNDIQAVEIDCSELAYISSAGLRVLMIIKKAIPDSEVVLTNVSPEVKQILETTGFIEMFRIS